MNDGRLVHRVQCGDSDALHQIYARYKDDLLTVAMSLLSNLHAAEDCVHDVFVHFAAEPTDLQVNSTLRGYLMRCVANRAKNLLKRQQLPVAGSARQQNDAGKRDNPAYNLMASEESVRVFAALENLPTEQREVITLHIHGQMTFTEIADQLDLSVNTVQSRYRYGIEKLRNIL